MLQVATSGLARTWYGVYLRGQLYRQEIAPLSAMRLVTSLSSEGAQLGPAFLHLQQLRPWLDA
jgi:hypothetical protein